MCTSLTLPKLSNVNFFVLFNTLVRDRILKVSEGRREDINAAIVAATKLGKKVLDLFWNELALLIHHLRASELRYQLNLMLDFFDLGGVYWPLRKNELLASTDPFLQAQAKADTAGELLAS